MRPRKIALEPTNLRKENKTPKTKTDHLKSNTWFFEHQHSDQNRMNLQISTYSSDSIHFFLWAKMSLWSRIAVLHEKLIRM